jgi:hypothetical protein
LIERTFKSELPVFRSIVHPMIISIAWTRRIVSPLLLGGGTHPPKKFTRAVPLAMCYTIIFFVTNTLQNFGIIKQIEQKCMSNFLLD